MLVNDAKNQQNEETNIESKSEYRVQILWLHVLFFIYIYGAGAYGAYLAFTSAYLKTSLFCYVMVYVGGLGITAGSHRLWCHRSYKAKWPLKILLCIFTSVASQSDIFEWCRDHRVHHKFAETDADPYNIKRGFFFAHVGWLMCKKHPDVKEKGKTVDLSDLLADPVVTFHKRFYYPLMLIFGFYLPTMIPVWLWKESLWNSFFVAGMLRYCASQNFTFLVNSAAHTYGYQPFDKSMEARENPFVAFLSSGEGWHNYHHVYPWDYSTSELGYKLNFTKLFIDLMALLGLAYDLKTVQKHMIRSRKLKTGDGTRMSN